MIQHSVLALDGVTVTKRRKALEKILSSARTSVYTAYFTQAVLIFFQYLYHVFSDYLFRWVKFWPGTDKIWNRKALTLKNLSEPNSFLLASVPFLSMPYHKSGAVYKRTFIIKMCSVCVFMTNQSRCILKLVSLARKLVMTHSQCFE